MISTETTQFTTILYVGQYYGAGACRETHTKWTVVGIASRSRYTRMRCQPSFCDSPFVARVKNKAPLDRRIFKHLHGGAAHI